MLKADECRRKAALFLETAEAAHGANARSVLCRVAEQWTELAEQIEQDRLSRSFPRHPAEQVQRAAEKAETIAAGDTLRARLRLTEPPEGDL
jgi:hypothetical protein